MNIFNGILNGLAELWAHKLRSALTIFCVMLGVCSLVATSGFMNGLFATWDESMEEAGGPQKISGYYDQVPERQEPFAQISRGFRLEDALDVRAMVPEARFISPEIDHSEARLSRGTKRTRLRVQGVTNTIFEINRYEIVSGRDFTDLDMVDRASVVILGSGARKRLFGENNDPLGQYVNIDGQPFRVVGLLKHYERLYKQYNVLDWKNDLAFIPVTTMAAKIKRSDKLSYLNMKAWSVDVLPDAIDAATNLIRHQHRGILDFKVGTNEQSLASYTAFKQGFFVAGGAIAAVSLIVSGIGTMNLMLASINERVREIGIRKALGATPVNVFVQFLAEAVTLSVLGGLIGIGVASAIIVGLQQVLPPGQAPLLSVTAFAIGFFFSVLAGVCAGVYPAIQAAKLDPIEALRYE